jgi:hypothetical protein
MTRVIGKPLMVLSALLFLAASIIILPCGALSQELDECLECHSDRNLTKTDAAGKVHSLYVDKKLFVESAHGKLNYTCMECHTEATLDHPTEGVPKAKCTECHEESQAKYETSEHGKLLASGDAKAPHCYDCHSMHYTLSSDNPRSSTNPNNISETCGTCHEELVNGPGLIESFIVTRLKGHGKVNLAGDFRIGRCSNCHFEVANHGKKEKVQPACAKCHEPCEGSINLGPIHKSDVFTQAPLRVAVKLFYGFGLAMIALAFMSMAGKKYTQPKADEQQTPGH